MGPVRCGADVGGEGGGVVSAAVRLRIYQVLTAVMPILAVYGVIADSQAGLWLALAAALLGTGGTALAAANTPAGRHRKGGE